MIHNVKLENFGPHDVFEHKFEPGVTLIVGKNGSGKSHIVQGIGWAIIGPKALDRTQSDYVRDGSDSMSAEVEIDILGKKHKFKRFFSKGSVTASVEVDEKVKATTVLGVQDYLDSMGFDSDSLSVLISMQDRLSEIITSSPAKRKDLFDKLLHTEMIRQAQNIARSESNIKVEEPEGSKKELKDKVKSIELNIKDIENKINNKQKLYNQQNTKIKDLQKQLEDIAKQNIFEDLDLYNDLKTQKTTLSNEKINLENKLLSLPDEDKKELLEELEKTNIKLEKLEKKKNLRNNTLNEINNEITKFNAEVEVSNKLSGQQIKCPECGAEFCSEHIAPDIEKLNKLNKLKDDCVTLCNKLDEQISELILKSQDIQFLIDEIEERHVVGEQLKETNEKLNIICEEFSKIEPKYKKFIEHQKSLKDSSINRNLTKLQDENNYVLLELRNLELTNDRLKNDLKVAKDNVIVYELAKQKYKYTLKKSRVWKDTTKHLGKFREFILTSALAWVSGRASQILQSIGTISDVKEDSRLELDSKLNFFLVDSDDTIAINRFSGGQKAAFSICLRMALSDYFSDHLGLRGLLILDAVFESMDEQNRQATAAALASAGPQQALIFAYEDLLSMEGKRIFL